MSLLQPLRRFLPGVQAAELTYSRGLSLYEQGELFGAVQCWRQAAEGEHREAQYRLGLLFARGEGVLQSMADAVFWYRRAAESGHVDAQYQLGLIYLRGVP